jgi:hypothetical protein
MKIGILTQPLKNNYGGLLQAYALQLTLKRMGHEVWIINRVAPKITLLRKLGSIIKQVILRYIFLRKTKTFSLRFIKDIKSEDLLIISQHTREFIKDHVQPVTEPIYTNRKLRQIAKQGYDAFIVGSDQVWRLNYSPDIFNFFLDFAINYKHIKRIAYGASFGLDEWHYPGKITGRCKKLIEKFDAVSVREHSAVDLCKLYFNIEARLVIDPTLLLTKEDYLDLIKDGSSIKVKVGLYYYILDMNDDSKALIDLISDYSKLDPYTVSPTEKRQKGKEFNINNCIYPPVPKWLEGFSKAEFIITDSFHGCIFSILFNVPFLVIGNRNRGLTRIESLLETFNLSARLVSPIDGMNIKNIMTPIDWGKINEVISSEKNQSMAFLRESLNKTE